MDMKKKLNLAILNRLLQNITKKKYIYGAVFFVSSGNNQQNLINANGEIKEDSRYYIASINKLFVGSIVLKLYTQKKLDLQDKISRYLSEDVIHRLHMYKGDDYSGHLTIAHLISQTSGLPCYLNDKQADGKTVMKELEAGIDQAWPINKVIGEIKQMKTHFPPGKKGSAKYIDTNHQILSMIIENITEESISQVLKSMFRELNLTQTDVCDETNLDHFVPIRYQSQQINIPKFLSSTGNDIFSTANDQMTFLKAFFGGYFFPRDRLKELEKWNRIFFPFQYGMGIQKFSIPRILSPFQPVPVMIGHCGSTGSVAFYIPDRDLYITGTVNQQARPNIAFQTMIKIINLI